MAVKITYFVHGTTTDNEQDIATGDLPGELSIEGRRQAAQLGVQVAHEHFDALFCSDLERAVVSAELGFGHKYAIKQDRRLRECNFGDFNGAKASLFKNRMAEYIDIKFPNGECYAEVETRVHDFVDFLKHEYNGQHIAIVGHQAPQLALEVILNGRSWQQAIAEDWRLRGAWQPGWDYVAS